MALVYTIITYKIYTTTSTTTTTTTTEKLRGRAHSEDLGVYEKIILEWILGK
jgi:hypothetical protein